MKRLLLVAAVVALAACARQEGTPATQADTTQQADTTKMAGDTAKKM